MSIQLEDPGWQVVGDPVQQDCTSNILHHDQCGVFMTAIQTNDISLQATVSSIMMNDRQALRMLFFDKAAEVEILECNIGKEVGSDDSGYWCSYFLGRETRPGKPEEYFAFAVIANCSIKSKKVPTVLSLWAQEDIHSQDARPSRSREQYAREYDHHFPLDALTRLRAQLNQLPQSIRVLQ